MVKLMIYSGYVAPSVVEENWKQSFTWLYEQASKEGGGEGQGTFLFPLTIHPQSSGKPHLLAMHERLVNPTSVASTGLVVEAKSWLEMNVNVVQQYEWLTIESRFISWLKTHEGVEFVICNQVNEEFRAGEIKGAEVRGGV